MLRARVRVLMRLEGGGAEEEEEGCEAEEEEEGVAGGMESVERLLLRRVRRMETEAVVGRRRVAEAEEARRGAEGTRVGVIGCVWTGLVAFHLTHKPQHAHAPQRRWRRRPRGRRRRRRSLPSWRRTWRAPP